jgi:acyl carrier protein
MAAYHNIGSARITEKQISSNALGELTSAIEVDPALLLATSTLETIAKEVGLKVYAFILRPAEELDLTKTLADLGVDSLVTVEIRNWIKRTFGGLDISTMQMLQAGSLHALGALIVAGLKEKFKGL